MAPPARSPATSRRPRSRMRQHRIDANHPGHGCRPTVCSNSSAARVGAHRSTSTRRLACRIAPSSTAPYLTLDPADEKSREGSDLPLRADLAADLQRWLADRLHRLQDEAGRPGAPIPARLAPDTPLFVVPARLAMILDRDLVAAGIARRVISTRAVVIASSGHGRLRAAA